MPSAVERLPCHFIELMNFVTRFEPYTASAGTVRFAVCPLRGIPVQLLLTLLRALGAIFRTSLLAVRNPHRIQRSANHVITHTRQILHAPAADQHNRVLL